MRALMLDDDQDDFFIIAKALAPEGVEVDLVRTVEAATTALASGEYSVVLVDHRLGHGSGLDLLKTRDGPDIPVIVLTGVDDSRVDAMALELGAAGFMNKSEVTGPLLARTIRYVTRQPREGDHLTTPAEDEDESRATNLKDVKLQVGLASGLTIKEAAEQAGVGLRTAYRRLKSPSFRKEVADLAEEFRARAINQALDRLA